MVQLAASGPFSGRWPQGFKCPRCAATEYCEIRDRQLLQCRCCRYQSSLIAGTVLQVASCRCGLVSCCLLAVRACPNVELGRRLGVSTNAAWRVQHKLMQAMIERDRRYKLGAAGPRIEIDDAYIGGERLGERFRAGSARSHPLSLPLRRPPMAGRCSPPSCAASRLAKPSGYAHSSWLERRSSGMAASGFAALPSNRVLSTNATSPGMAEAPRVTPLSAG